jgi:putative spermidine/putrescine transport system ATP-binding protein
MLSLVRLDNFGARMPSQLSGGQQQRVALGRALAYDPPILLMDEPLSALDKKLREEMQIEIRRIHKSTGVTILYVTHDQEEALRLSDRIAIFNNGYIEQVGTGRELYINPATRFVAGFVGDSNFLKIQKIKKSDLEKVDVVLPDGTQIQSVPHQRSLNMQATELMVRPQFIRYSINASGLPVTIRDVTFLGDTISALLVTRWGQEIWARTPMQDGITTGINTHITWNSADSYLF